MSLCNAKGAALCIKHDDYARNHISVVHEFLKFWLKAFFLVNHMEFYIRMWVMYCIQGVNVKLPGFFHGLGYEFGFCPKMCVTFVSSDSF